MHSSVIPSIAASPTGPAVSAAYDKLDAIQVEIEKLLAVLPKEGTDYTVTEIGFHIHTHDNKRAHKVAEDIAILCNTEIQYRGGVDRSKAYYVVATQDIIFFIHE